MIQYEILLISYHSCIVLLSLILGISIWIVARFAIVGVIGQCAPISGYRGLDASEGYIASIVNQLSHLLFRRGSHVPICNLSGKE
jgi:predicted ferric reductase